jgi:hypothetical protein
MCPSPREIKDGLFYQDNTHERKKIPQMKSERKLAMERRLMFNCQKQQMVTIAYPSSCVSKAMTNPFVLAFSYPSMSCHS